jgi:hypothetical protein
LRWIVAVVAEHRNGGLIFFVEGRFVMDPVVTEEAASDFTLITGQVTENGREKGWRRQ